MFTAQKFRLSFCLAIAAIVITPSFVNADEIVVYQSTQSEKCVTYYQATTYEYYDEELEEFVIEDAPGGRSTYGNKTTGYVIFNKTTSEYREVTYSNYNYRDEDGQKVKVKEYYSNGDYPDTETGSLFPSIFETDPEARKNYLVLSFRGTSELFPTYFTQSDEFGTFSATNTDTLSGVSKIQKIKTETETFLCQIPATIKGDVESDYESISPEDGSINRTQCHGKRTLRLDKRLTQIALSSSSLAQVEDRVKAHLSEKGYVDFNVPVNN